MNPTGAVQHHHRLAVLVQIEDATRARLPARGQPRTRKKSFEDPRGNILPSIQSPHLKKHARLSANYRINTRRTSGNEPGSSEVPMEISSLTPRTPRWRVHPDLLR